MGANCPLVLFTPLCACACRGDCARNASNYICLSLCAWQVAANVKPSLVIFVMDGSIGQAAFDQAKAFKDAVEVRGGPAMPAASVMYRIIIVGIFTVKTLALA